MHRAPVVLVLAMVSLSARAGWTQGEHRHRAPTETPDPYETQVNIYTVGDQGVLSSERRNISAMIRATSSGRPEWNVSGRGTHGG